MLDIVLLSTFLMLRIIICIFFCILLLRHKYSYIHLKILKMFQHIFYTHEAVYQCMYEWDKLYPIIRVHGVHNIIIIISFTLIMSAKNTFRLRGMCIA